MKLAILLTLIISQAAMANKGERLFKSKCMSCHTTNNAFPKVPILFGQEPKYIEIQLNNYKNKTRIDHNMGVMNNIAFGLKDKEIKEISSYLAGVDPCVVAAPQINTRDEAWLATYRAGMKLAKDNNCMHCHASFHHAAPRLHGQKLGYLEHTLQEFLDTKRTNKYMDRILPILNGESIESLSVYFNAQRLMRECFN